MKMKEIVEYSLSYGVGRDDFINETYEDDYFLTTVSDKFYEEFERKFNESKDVLFDYLEEMKDQVSDEVMGRAWHLILDCWDRDYIWQAHSILYEGLIENTRQSYDNVKLSTSKTKIFFRSIFVFFSNLFY